MLLLHCADLHLGRSPYRLRERFEDFGRVFEAIAERAVQERADLVTIGGDLFDRRDLNAATLAQAIGPLQQLQEAAIPVVAIEGNHDRSWRKEERSWLDFLAEMGLLILLRPEWEEGRLKLPSWDPIRRRGAVCRIDRLELIGLGYPGALAPKLLEQLVEVLPHRDSEPITVVLLHAGIGSHDPRYGLGAVPPEALGNLSGRVDLLLLGHWHTPAVYRLGESLLALMPGSPEVCSADESETEHGFYWVRFPDRPDGAIEPRFEATPHRPHYRLTVSVAGASSVESVIQRTLDEVRSLTRPSQEPAAVLEVRLEGSLRFDPYLLPPDAVTERIREEGDWLHVEVINATTLEGTGWETGDLSLLTSSTESVERKVIVEMVEAHPEYRDAAESIAELVIQWREVALDGEGGDPHEQLVELLELTVRQMEGRQSSQA